MSARTTLPALTMPLSKEWLIRRRVCACDALRDRPTGSAFDLPSWLYCLHNRNLRFTDNGPQLERFNDGKSAVRSFNIEALDAQMRYLEFDGEDVALFMIHGLGCASSFEYPHVALAPALRGRRSILIDLLGFGFSDCPSSFGYSVNDHANQVARFISEFSANPIDLYGHSMGGSVAIEVADLLGQQVRSLVVSEANLDSGGGVFSCPIAAAGEASYVHRGHSRTITKAREDGHAAWAATMSAASAQAVFRGAKSLVDGSVPNWRSRFLRHPSRKTFLFGERSLPDRETEFFSSHGIPVLIVPDAGHAMSLENPAGLAVAIAKATARG